VVRAPSPWGLPLPRPPPPPPRTCPLSLPNSRPPPTHGAGGDDGSNSPKAPGSAATPPPGSTPPPGQRPLGGSPLKKPEAFDIVAAAKQLDLPPLDLSRLTVDAQQRRASALAAACLGPNWAPPQPDLAGGVSPLPPGYGLPLPLARPLTRPCPSPQPPAPSPRGALPAAAAAAAGKTPITLMQWKAKIDAAR